YNTRNHTVRDVAEIVAFAIRIFFTAEAFNRQSAIDLAENSAYMQGVRNFGGNLPKIIVHGNEARPVHYRLVSSFRSNGANDTEVLNIINAAKTVYHAEYARHINGAVALGPLTAPIMIALANRWKAGYD